MLSESELSRLLLLFVLLFPLPLWLPLLAGDLTVDAFEVELDCDSDLIHDELPTSRKRDVKCKTALNAMEIKFYNCERHDAMFLGLSQFTQGNTFGKIKNSNYKLMRLT